MRGVSHNCLTARLVVYRVLYNVYHSACDPREANLASERDPGKGKSKGVVVPAKGKGKDKVPRPPPMPPPPEMSPVAGQGIVILPPMGKGKGKVTPMGKGKDEVTPMGKGKGEVTPPWRQGPYSQVPLLSVPDEPAPAYSQVPLLSVPDEPAPDSEVPALTKIADSVVDEIRSLEEWSTGLSYIYIYRERQRDIGCQTLCTGCSIHMYIGGCRLYIYTYRCTYIYMYIYMGCLTISE